MDTNVPHQPSGFRELGVNDKILKILELRKFSVPTPIQHQAIPIALQGKDVIGIAQTGTGKTFAFGIPMVERLAKEGGRGLILVPTRELAYQVEESLNTFAPTFGIRIAVFVGGASMMLQRQMLKNNPRILVATPGRLNDHLEQGTVTLKEVKILVLDEADRMLDMGFKPQIDRILNKVPRERQTMLFSATMAQEILKLATAQMTLPLRIEVAPQGTSAENVEQEVFIMHREEKIVVLKKILEEKKGTVLLFSRTKHGAKKLTHQLIEMGHTAAEIHANRTLAQRRAALDGFKRGRYRVLVATDIAARGIDVKEISLVLNYDLPDDPADYVHRIGRTGRAGSEGLAISFATPDQLKTLRDIEKLIRKPLKSTRSAAAASAPSFAPAQKRPGQNSHHAPGGNRRNNFRRRR